MLKNIIKSTYKFILEIVQIIIAFIFATACFVLFCIVWAKLAEWSIDNLDYYGNIIQNKQDQITWTIIGQYFLSWLALLGLAIPIFAAFPKYRGIVVVYHR